MENDKPITDKENFPPVAPELSVAGLNAAYFDGCSDGYRKAVKDIMLFGIIGFAIVALVAEIKTRS